MKPFRKHVALAVDGGGLRGTMVSRALAVVEEELGKPWSQMVQLAAGTSTGSIISSGIAIGATAARIHELYVHYGPQIFRKTWRYYWPFARHRYPARALVSGLRSNLGEVAMGDLWSGSRAFDLIITTRDLVENRTRFVKSWKPEYQKWPVWYATLCSCTVPTFFPVVDGRYVDGGVGSYTNPCYIAAYDASFCLGWMPQETTLISLGTGRGPGGFQPGEASRFHLWDWLIPMLDTFVTDATDQQVRLVQQFFPGLDFRRFQIDMDPPLSTHDPADIPALTQLGEKLGEMILNDQVDAKVARAGGTARRRVL